MVLALVDDLMFRSKIKSTAAGIGVSVKFVGSKDAALASMRAELPALVILDLNNPRIDPIGTVTEIKHDTMLSSVRTVGFVSHVDADTMRAAKAAGVDDVLARSAFTVALPSLLTSSRD
jgi:CheY-like chemotaxis protein